MTDITISPEMYPDRRFRIDGFSVPEEARGEFEAAMKRNLEFIGTIPGFLGHAVFEKAGGPSAFNVLTIAAWESAEAMEQAGAQVRAYYERIGFDMPAQLARWGVKAEVGTYGARP